MKLYRIWAVAYRLLIQYHRDFNKLASILYWPILDIVIFGFMITGIQGTNFAPEITKGLLISVAFWPVVNRGSMTIALSLFEELRSKNLANLLTTPLSIYEWILGSIVEGLLSSIVVILICGLILWTLFSISILDAGIILLPIGIFGFLTGIAISFLTSAVLIRWGTRVQTIIWMSGWAFGLISGVFYPIETLPSFLQTAARGFPLHYLFSNIRSIIAVNTFSLNNLLIGMALSLFYFLLFGGLFLLTYEQSKETGLNNIL